MAVIKGKERVLKKKLSILPKISDKSKKILRRPQDNQPIPTIAV